MDERKGKPSASYFEQMALCPGSWKAQAEFPQESNRFSESGNLIHAALAGDTRAYCSMTSDETRAFEDMERRVADLLTEHGFENATRADEWRMWEADHFSGKADRIYFAGNKAFVLDFKSGWKGAESAPSNLQLRALAVLAHDHFGVDLVYCAIVPAHGKPTVTLYDIDAIEEAWRDIERILTRAEQPDAPRIPGEKQCRYCRARAHCPEARALMLSVAEIPKAAVATLPAAQLVEAYKKVAIAEKICGAIRDEIKARLSRGEEVPGLTLKPGSPRESIINLPVVHSRAVALGVTTEQFTEACSLTKTAGKKLVQDATGKKGKALEEEFEKLIDGCVLPGKQPEPSIDWLKEKEAA